MTKGGSSAALLVFVTGLRHISLPAQEMLTMAGKDVPVSPLAPKRQPKVPPVPGVRFATAEAGIKLQGPHRCRGWRCSTRARRSPVSSPARNAPPRRSTGAARI